MGLTKTKGERKEVRHTYIDCKVKYRTLVNLEHPKKKNSF